MASPVSVSLIPVVNPVFQRVIAHYGEYLVKNRANKEWLINTLCRPSIISPFAQEGEDGMILGAVNLLRFYIKALA